MKTITSRFEGVIWKNIFKALPEFMRQNDRPVMLLSVISLIIVIVLNLSGVLNDLENSITDYKFVRYSDTLTPDSSIVLVAIDQKSLDFFDSQKVGWPWPREFYAEVVDYLNYCGAKAIVFDMDFSTAEIERAESKSSDSEERFAGAISKAGNVILGASLTNETNNNIRQTSISPGFYNKKRPDSTLNVFNSSNAPLLSFQAGARSIASTNIYPDKDGVIRRVQLLFNYRGYYFPGLAYSAYLNLKNISSVKIDSACQGLPLSEKKEFLINWYGGGGESGRIFKYYSIHSIIVSGYKIKNSLPPDVEPGKFKDKIVIIGGTAVGLLDNQTVPVSSSGPYPGMELHATVLSNLLQNDIVHKIPDLWIYFIVLLSCFLTAAIFFKVRKVSNSVLLIIVALGVYCFVSFYLFYLFRYIVSIILPVSGMLFVFISSAVYRYNVEGKQKKELKRVFSRYLNPQVIDELIKSPDQVDLKGKEIFATVYFSDIKDFTNISEKLNPKELVGYLNKYFSYCTESILKYDGMLDKYMGDSVMAVFGAPLLIENHALNACLAAIDIISRVRELYSEDKTGMPFFYTRIGIHSGNMVVGNIGSESHLDYTVIGDSVNLASRLEGVNKMFGTNIIISEDTYNIVKDFVETRQLDHISVKGKSIPVKIYELVSRKDQLSKEEKQFITDFEAGIFYYKNREWDTALEVFKILSNIRPEDIASRVYIERCKNLLEQGVSADWDDVTKLQTK